MRKTSDHPRIREIEGYRPSKNSPNASTARSFCSAVPTLTLTSESPAPQNDEQSRTMIPFRARKSQTASDWCGETSTGMRFASDGYLRKRNLHQSFALFPNKLNTPLQLIPIAKRCPARRNRGAADREKGSALQIQLSSARDMTT